MAHRLTTKTYDERQVIKERIASYYKQYLGISGYAFCKNMGLMPSYMKTFTGNPKSNIRALFKATYPAFNLQWAITGKGTMINPGWEGKEATVFIQTPRTGKKIVEAEEEKQQQMENIGIQQEDMHSMIEMLKDQLEKKDSLIEKLWEKLHDLSDKLDKAQKELNK